jgi:hypothetical protein
MKDRSTKVGGRRNSVGNNTTAGNSVGTPGKVRDFNPSKTTAVAKQSGRFKKTRTRRGEKNAVS